MSESLKNLSELSDAKLAELVKSGNDSAFDVLTLRYLRNIGFLAKKYSADGYERNDFVQEGLLGLLYACRTFDSNNKASFKSYVDIVTPGMNLILDDPYPIYTERVIPYEEVK